MDAIRAAGPAVRTLGLPPRIEHVQLLHPADLPRFAALGVMASMQPSHCTSDIDIALRHWGPRVDRSYPWRSLLRGGASLVTTPRYMPSVFIAKAGLPLPSIAISPPSPPISVIASIVSLVAACTVAPFQAMRSHTWRAALSRMKYSPVPVAETAPCRGGHDFSLLAC